jgi:excisionase family DNA binding protein
VLQNATSAIELATPLTAWLTADEAAQYLKVKTRTLLLWARQGKVRGYTLSGTTRHVWRFRQLDLDATLTAPSVLNPEGMVQ